MPAFAQFTRHNGGISTRHCHQRRPPPQGLLYPAGFSALSPSNVSRTPGYPSPIDELAAIFRYCLHPQPPKGEVWTEKMMDRQSKYGFALLRFLRVSVATRCCPDAAHNFSTDLKRNQWNSNARVVQFNPCGRRQITKYRPAVPGPELFARLADRAQQDL